MLSAGGSQPPCAIFFGYELRFGFQISVLSIPKLQNAKDEKSVVVLDSHLHPKERNMGGADI